MSESRYIIRLAYVFPIIQKIMKLELDIKCARTMFCAALKFQMLSEFVIIEPGQLLPLPWDM